MNFNSDGVTYPKLKVVHYRVYCLEVLQNMYCQLSKKDRNSLDNLLEPYGKLDLIQELDSGLLPEHELPLTLKNKSPNMLEKLILSATGTPWDMPSFFRSK